jgi:hypothetical protein
MYTVAQNSMLTHKNDAVFALSAIEFKFIWFVSFYLSVKEENFSLCKESIGPARKGLRGR